MKKSISTKNVIFLNNSFSEEFRRKMVEDLVLKFDEIFESPFCFEKNEFVLIFNDSLILNHDDIQYMKVDLCLLNSDCYSVHIAWSMKNRELLKVVHELSDFPEDLNFYWTEDLPKQLIWEIIKNYKKSCINNVTVIVNKNKKDSKMSIYFKSHINNVSNLIDNLNEFFNKKMGKDVKCNFTRAIVNNKFGIIEFGINSYSKDKYLNSILDLITNEHEYIEKIEVR